jgi:hypothetical protein
VLATTVEGTRCAMANAKQLTDGLDGRIILIVPRLKSLSIPFDLASDDRTAIGEEHRTLAASAGADVTVLLCVCERLDDVVHQMLGRSSLVIVGGRTKTWWPSREQRLARRLTGQGYPVVFAQVGAAHVPPGVPVMAS